MFFSTEGDVVYEAAQADLTVQDVDQLVDFGLSWTPYKMVDGRYYTPAKELNMVSMELPIGEYTVEQMRGACSLTLASRAISGKKTARRFIQTVSGACRWIRGKMDQLYRSGRHPVSDPGKDVLSAIDFVNQHGAGMARTGWLRRVNPRIERW